MLCTSGAGAVLTALPWAEPGWDDPVPAVDSHLHRMPDLHVEWLLAVAARHPDQTPALADSAARTENARLVEPRASAPDATMRGARPPVSDPHTPGLALLGLIVSVWRSYRPGSPTPPAEVSELVEGCRVRDDRLLEPDFSFLIALPAGDATGKWRTSRSTSPGAPPSRASTTCCGPQWTETRYRVVTESGTPVGACLPVAVVSPAGRLARHQSYFTTSFHLLDWPQTARRTG